MVHVVGPDDREVGDVEDGDLVDAEAFGQSDGGGVDRAEARAAVQVAVAVEQLTRAAQVLGRQVDLLEFACGDGVDDVGLSLGADPGADHPADLGHHVRAHEQFAGACSSRSRHSAWRESRRLTAATSGPVSTRITPGRPRGG